MINVIVAYGDEVFLPALGPVACGECHAPGMFWAPVGWRERWWVALRGGGLVAEFDIHACTARSLPNGLRRRTKAGGPIHAPAV